jgi:hypothetical protein
MDRAVAAAHRQIKRRTKLDAWCDCRECSRHLCRVALRPYQDRAFVT